MERYYVLSIEDGEPLGHLTKLHYRNPARAETSKTRLEETTGVPHAVFIQKNPGAPFEPFTKPVGATPCP